MLLLAPVKMLTAGKKPSIYWKVCEGAMEFPSRKNRKHLKMGHISVDISGCLPLLKMVSRKCFLCFGGWSSGVRRVLE